MNADRPEPPSAAPPSPAAPSEPAGAVCPHCRKPLDLCVCDHVVPVDTRVELLVLQHPQEQEELLGSARLAVRHLTRAAFRIGLSWPSLGKALGREADPKRWAVLHLGSVDMAALPEGRDLVVVDKDGKPVPDQDRALAGIEGVVVFDGTWSQAKTLWWRNPWVLKARRLVLRPREPSLYGRLRKEPRREGLSTLEAAAFVVARLEGRPEIEKTMLSNFRRMLQRYRDRYAAERRPTAGRRPKSPVVTPPTGGPDDSAA